MSFMKGAIWSLVIFLLASATVLAISLPGQASVLGTNLDLMPANENGSVLRASVMVFEPVSSMSGAEREAALQKITEDCKNDPQYANNFYGCLQVKSAELDAKVNNSVNVIPLKDAHIRFQYYNVLTNQLVDISECSDKVADTEATAYRTSTANGSQVPFQYYYAECAIPDSYLKGQRRVTIHAIFEPQPGQQVDGNDLSSSVRDYPVEQASISPSGAITKQIIDMIKGVAQGQGAGGSTLPCVGVFLIMGLLLASLYFSGKSPISLLDITTPRLPTPRGVAAGGQIVLPFGYTELNKTNKDKMAAAAKALEKSLSFWQKPGDRSFETLSAKLNSVKPSAADKAAGDVAQGKLVGKSILAAGRHVGMSEAELAPLANQLPYHYGEAEHKVVAQIMAKLTANGGADAIRAMNIQGYAFGVVTGQRLEALSGHPAIGQRSAWVARVSQVTGKAFGANRFAIVGSFTAGIASMERAGRQTLTMGKVVVTEAPGLARGVAKTIIEVKGGPHAMENLAARAKTSSTAAWAHAQLTKNPSKVVVGTMFPVSDKMAHLFNELHHEALRDEMRYVMRQFYRSYGINFAIDEVQLASMGHDIKLKDILAVSGYTEAVQAPEKHLLSILRNNSLSGSAKLEELIVAAKAHAGSEGLRIDPHLYAFHQELAAIEHNAAMPDYQKFLSIQQMFEKNRVEMAAKLDSKTADIAYICHVGGNTLRGTQMWETLVLRTQIWDAENGHLHQEAGIKEGLLSGRLNAVNRETTLDGSAAAGTLPAYMRADLKVIAEQNRSDMEWLLGPDGRKLFEQAKNKSTSSASISEIVEFMYGGNTPKTHHIDPATGKMVWWGADSELSLPPGTTLVDMKRHWITKPDPRENFALGQWVESRSNMGYISHYDPSQEARLNRMPGSASWSEARRAEELKKMMVQDLLVKDMEARFNSHFAQNTYGTTHETTRFYAGIVSGFLEEAMRRRGIDINHPDMTFLTHLDTSNPNHLGELSRLMTKYRADFERVQKGEVTYDDVLRAPKAMVMLHEGGLAFYSKGMMLSDMDRLLNGQVSIPDKNGNKHAFIPEDVPIKFTGSTALAAAYGGLMGNKDPQAWDGFINDARTWAKGDADRQKVLAAVVWNYAQTTHDYSRFWKDTAVTVENKRNVTPVAPSLFRFFGSDAPGLTTFLKPYRDIALTGGDYVSKVAYGVAGMGYGGSKRSGVASYEITPVTEIQRQQSMKLAMKVMSGEAIKSMGEEEAVAYRANAIAHFAMHQAWDYSIDRHPGRTSTSHGTTQAMHSFFQYGPATTYSMKDNLKAYLDRGKYANFMAGPYGFGLDIAGKIMRPYQSMVRGMQMAMQGYPPRWNHVDDPLGEYKQTDPRLLEAAQAVNPFSFKWFPGKTAERLAKLNVFGGSLEKHQLAGSDFLLGLRQAPQDIYLSRKGVYSSARTDEANPGASFYNYRHELQIDAPMAEYAYRNRIAAYMYDDRVRRAAMDTTVRRTVSAEALGMRREQEMRGFGMVQNSMFGWANPLAFIWHMPVPGVPSSVTPKDIVSKWVARSKHGYGGEGTFGDKMERVAGSLARGGKSFMQPHKLSMVTTCGKCGRRGMRGSHCQCGWTY